MKHFIIFLGSC